MAQVQAEANDALTRMAEELGRQDAGLAVAKIALTALEQREVHVPEAFFRELDDACAAPTLRAPEVRGIRV